MAALETFVDAINAAHNEFGAGHIEDLAATLTDYTVSQIFKAKGPYAPQVTSGAEIEFNILDRYSANARSVEPYEQDQTVVTDLTKKGKMPWRQITVNEAYDEEELLNNQGPQQILDLVKLKRMAAMGAMAELMETLFWNLASAGNTKAFAGLLYWIVKSATTPTGGFTGGNPSGYSAVANINTDAASRYKNWSANYTEPTKTDLVRAMRKMRMNTRWRSPFMGGITPYSRGGSDVWFTNTDTAIRLEELVETQNENLGVDVAPMGGSAKDLFMRDGHVLFRGNPIVAAQSLDADTSNPVYGVCFSSFGFRVRRGKFFRQTTMRAPNQHTVIVTHWDTSLNTFCENRRKQGVIYIA